MYNTGCREHAAKTAKQKKKGSFDAFNFVHFIIAPQAQWILTPRTESIVNHRSPEPGKQLQVRIAWQGQ